jgi:hypothetical protein
MKSSLRLAQSVATRKLLRVVAVCGQAVEGMLGATNTGFAAGAF